MKRNESGDVKQRSPSWPGLTRQSMQRRGRMDARVTPAHDGCTNHGGRACASSPVTFSALLPRLGARIRSAVRCR